MKDKSLNRLGGIIFLLFLLLSIILVGTVDHNIAQDEAEETESIMQSLRELNN